MECFELLRFVKVTDSAQLPFALSLSKGGMPSPRALSWFDRLTTNGRWVVSYIYDSQ